MPESDPAISWLLANDPEAHTRSHDSYLRDHGILSANAKRAARLREVSLTAAERHQMHCPGCESRYAMHRAE